LICYSDTSAVAKLIFEEAESQPLRECLHSVTSDGDGPVSSYLLETELRRTAIREDLPQKAVTRVLDMFGLILPDRATFTESGMFLLRNLRSLDALHAAAALRASTDAFITCDHRLAEAAEACGLSVRAPGT